MALKAVHVSDVPNLDHVPENASLSLYSTRFSKGKLPKTERFFIDSWSYHLIPGIQEREELTTTSQGGKA
ncbi:unnamed protein product [Dovyalis caffra]|uniref:Uncharacterized protein n=1 Tax=Dovyalis caffra TaxID=77055 RepID=A0AAV1SLL6_9ROSI|nr:unnamed protein product [Dovyalis caffra]